MTIKTKFLKILLVWVIGMGMIVGVVEFFNTKTDDIVTGSSTTYIQVGDKVVHHKWSKSDPNDTTYDDRQFKITRPNGKLVTHDEVYTVIWVSKTAVRLKEKPIYYDNKLWAYGVTMFLKVEDYEAMRERGEIY